MMVGKGEEDKHGLSCKNKLKYKNVLLRLAYLNGSIVRCVKNTKYMKIADQMYN